MNTFNVYNGVTCSVLDCRRTAGWTDGDWLACADHVDSDSFWHPIRWLVERNAHIEVHYGKGQ